MRLPHAGQAAASSRHRWPVPTQTLVAAESAAHTTSGSSTLATTVVDGWVSSILRHDRAWRRTSPMRSSWSRLRLSSTTTSGVDRRGRVGQQPLVDLEGHHRPRPLVGQGAHQPRQEVGPGGVGLHRPPGGQRRGQQPGGGGLAVGAGDERHLVAGGHLLQGRRVDGQRHPAADDGARAPPGPAGDLRHHPAGEGRGSGPQGEVHGLIFARKQGPRTTRETPRA